MGFDRSCVSRRVLLACALCTFAISLDGCMFQRGTSTSGAAITAPTGPGPTSTSDPTSTPEISRWTPVEGNSLIASAAALFGAPSLVNSGGKLYAAWVTGAGTFNPKVAAFNGDPSAPSWTDITGNLPQGMGITQLILSDLGGKLYAAYAAGKLVHVAVYNGNNGAPAWTSVDGAPGLLLETNNNQFEQDIDLVSSNGKLYVAFTENEVDMGGNYRVHVKVYNGNDAAPSWTLVDGSANGLNTSATSFAYSPGFGAKNNKLYLATAEQVVSGGWSHHVAVYNGNDAAPAWTFIDGSAPNTINTGDYASRGYPLFAALGTSLYFFWNLTSVSQGTLNQLDGALYNANDAAPAWENVSGTGSSSLGNLAQRATGSAELNSKLYLAAGSHVVVFNSNNMNPQWSPVDGAGMTSIARSSGDSIIYLKLAVLGNQLYALWPETATGSAHLYVSVGQ
jgi:hypothetical protein